MNIKIFWIGVLVFAGLMLSGCGYSIKWNQKMTVDVEIDGQTYSGSSVSEFYYKKYAYQLLPDMNTSSSRLTGEAVVVDMGEHGLLFALWGDRSSISRASVVTYGVDSEGRYKGGPFKTSGSKRAKMKQLKKRMSSMKKAREVGEIPANNNSFPVIVGLPDRDNPESFKIVRDFRYRKRGFTKSANNPGTDLFHQIYGEDAKITVRFGITKEPVTVGGLKKVFSRELCLNWRELYEEWRKTFSRPTPVYANQVIVQPLKPKTCESYSKENIK